MTEPTELLACPFCGSKATASVNKGESLWSHDVVDWTRVHCTNDDCNAQTEATCEGYEPSAIEVWNRRTTPAVAGEPFCYVSVNKQGDITRTMKRKDKWTNIPLYTTPQPTQAQAGAVPLTDEQIDAAAKKLAECMEYPWEFMPEPGRKNMRKHAQAVLETAHGIGIKGGQHGADN